MVSSCFYLTFCLIASIANIVYCACPCSNDIQTKYLKLNYNRTSEFNDSMISIDMAYFNSTILNADISYAVGLITAYVQNVYPTFGLVSFYLTETLILTYSDGTVTETVYAGFATDHAYSDDIVFLTIKRELHAIWHMDTSECDLPHAAEVVRNGEYNYFTNSAHVGKELGTILHLNILVTY